MRYWGFFAGFACFSECFLSIRDVVWLWAFACRMVVDFACRKVVDFACRKVVGFVCRMVVDLLVGWLWALLVLESFLEGFGMLESEYSLLEKRK